MGKSTAVAYYRTSSAANVGSDKDSERRQREAVATYAKIAKLDVDAEFYDAAVSGADPVDARKGFVALLSHCAMNDVRVVLVENASRFARDLTVQLTGHALLQSRGIELVPVDAPTHFTDPTPTAEMVRQILGAVSQFEKASIVAKLRHARDSIRVILVHPASHISRQACQPCCRRDRLGLTSSRLHAPVAIIRPGRPELLNCARTVVWPRRRLGDPPRTHRLCRVIADSCLLPAYCRANGRKGGATLRPVAWIARGR